MDQIDEPEYLALPSFYDDGIEIRFLRHEDYHAFRDMHFQMFPIDYEERFFQKAVDFEEGIVSIVAIETKPETLREVLIGFMTWKIQPLHACHLFDRKLLGLDSRFLDRETVAYIMTLGVAPSHRKRGIASHLLGKVMEHSRNNGCRAVYLHVVDYNEPAMRLYSESGFSNLGSLKDFYFIGTGRQPNPSRTWYDAYFYAKNIGGTSIALTPRNLMWYMLFPIWPAVQAFSATCSSLSSNKLQTSSLPVQGGSANGYIPPSNSNNDCTIEVQHVDGGADRQSANSAAASGDMSRFGKALKALFS